VSGFATLVWAPTGISLAALLAFGRRLWPGIALGAFAANYATGAPAMVACGIAFGNTLEALAAVTLLHRYTGFRRSLDRLSDVAGLILLGAILSTAVSASIGVASLWLGGIVPAEKAAITWVSWWLGDMMGDLLVAPLLLTWSGKWPRLAPARALEAVALAAAVLAILWYEFVRSQGVDGSAYSKLYVLFPPLIWACTRFEQRGATAAVFGAAAFAIASTAEGLGPFTTADPLSVRLTHLQIYLGVVALTALVLAAVVMDGRRAHRRLEEALERKDEASRLKSQFLANISHEIRTPLNGIIGASELLVETPLSGEQSELGRMIKDCGARLLAIVNDVLDFSKIEAGRMDLDRVDMNLREIVEAQGALFAASARERGLTLSVHLDDGVPAKVHGDAGKLGQILLNLLGNAVKFTEKGGVTVRVSTEPSPPGRVQIGISVEDTGIGVPRGALSRLFQPFSQADGTRARRYGGTGLGLSISKRLVELMGGKIGVQSEEGRGSRFWFSLPFELPETPGAAERPGDPAPRAAPAGKGVVLLAEDNRVNQVITRRQLESLGYQVEIVSNGSDAIRAAGNQHYAFIIMDCQMPVIDGLEATRAIRELEGTTGRRVPIIALTAHATPEDEAGCLASGMDAYLAKPVTAIQLAAAINRWVAG